jgi:hypothetical protein
MNSAAEMRGAIQIWHDLHVGPVWYGDLTGVELIVLARHGAWGGFHGVFAVDGIYQLQTAEDRARRDDRLVFLTRQIRLVEEILAANPAATVRDTAALRVERANLLALGAGVKVVEGDWITIQLVGESQPLYSHRLGGRYGRRVGQAVYAVGDDAW